MTNGYQPTMINRCIYTTQTPRRENKPKPPPISFVRIPFISENFNKSMSSLWRSLHLPVRVVNAGNTSLRQATKKQITNTSKACKKRPCFITDKKLCFLHHVVYQSECSCGSTYIGSTTRYLHDRIGEHMKCRQSAIFQHRQTCPADGRFVTTILSKHNNNLHLRISEGMYICRLSPSLNRRAECEHVTCFIRNYNVAPT